MPSKADILLEITQIGLDLIGIIDTRPQMYRDPNRPPAPDNLMSSTEGLYELLGDRGGVPSAVLPYVEEGAAAGDPIEGAEVQISSSYRVQVVWDEERGEWLRWQLGGPHTEEEAWEACWVYVAGWLLHGHGLWAVTRKYDEAILGFVLVGLEWGDAEPELGWKVLTDARGQGYATEAARAARDWALSDGGLDTLVSYVHPENARAIALAKRLGALPNAHNPHPVEGTLAFRHEAAL